MTKKVFNFEKAYARLEEILSKMNENTIALEESLALYEEADGLMKECSKYLSDAEQKIEVMLKDRDKNILTDESGNPKTALFETDNEQLLARDVKN